VMRVGGVCCAQANHCLRRRSYTYISAEVRETSFALLNPRPDFSVDWRRPPHPVYTADYATYVQILTWFFDSPSTLCPFSVHRMALAGKELGKDVGQWFGPSTAAGAIKCVGRRRCSRFYAHVLFRSLVQNFPEASLGISVAVDGQIFQTDVYSASHSPTQSPRPRKLSRWGDRAVVVLIGIRLGLDGVNPIYYDTIKVRGLRSFFHVRFDRRVPSRRSTRFHNQLA